MKFDLRQKNRAKELLLSENRAVWPPCRASRVKACAVVSHWGGGGANVYDVKYFKLIHAAGM